MKKRLLISVLLVITMVILAWPQTSVVEAQGSVEEYADVNSLKQAVEICKQLIVEAGHEEYAALVSEQRVREAIRHAIRSYEFKLTDTEEVESNFFRSEAYFRNVVKPKFVQIAEEGRWPAGSSFSSAYKTLSFENATSHGEKIDMDRNSGFAFGFEDVAADRVSFYDGFSLSLNVSFSDSDLEVFTLPVIELFYGRSR